MWEPSTWEDIEAALGNVAEGQHIDFKNAAALDSAPVRAPELAKDIAAMSVLGGVIAYGIDEINEIATAAGGVRIAGQANRIHQILSARVTPAIGVVVRPIENPATPGEGVVVVIVPPSVSAPHYWNERFPVRSGTTIRSLSEREIADLYDRRRSIVAEQTGEANMLDGYVGPAWFHATGLDMTDVGVLQVTVTPIGPSRLEYRLASQLVEASRSAERLVATILRPVPSIPEIFTNWRPFEARGWTSGREEVAADYHLRNPTFTATMLYAAGFSFQLTCPLRYQGVKYVFEYIWAANLVGMLALAGTFYADNSAIALVRVDIRLSGLEGSHPGPNQGRFAEGPIELSDYQERGVLSVSQIAATPQDGAAELMDRFFAAIFPYGPDMRGRLGIT